MNTISRSSWKAEHGRGYETDGAKTLVVVHHDGPYPSRSQPDMTLEQEAKLVRFYEHFHATGLTKTNKRIAYTALGMQTGRRFEGCGWGRVGAHTANMNSSSYGYFFPLCGSRNAPTPVAIESFQEWREEGVLLGHLSPSHIVKGHQDFNKPACPGNLVYDAAVLNLGVIVSPPTVADIIHAHPSLRIGKGGIYALAAEREAVRYLQRKLGMPDQYRTGYFGTITDTYVRKMQVAAGLRRSEFGGSAIVGPSSWKVIDRL